jgi:hypothetical protein
VPPDCLSVCLNGLKKSFLCISDMPIPVSSTDMIILGVAAIGEGELEGELEVEVKIEAISSGVTSSHSAGWDSGRIKGECSTVTVTVPPSQYFAAFESRQSKFS